MSDPTPESIKAMRTAYVVPTLTFGPIASLWIRRALGTQRRLITNSNPNAAPIQTMMTMTLPVTVCAMYRHLPERWLHVFSHRRGRGQVKNSSDQIMRQETQPTST